MTDKAYSPTWPRAIFDTHGGDTLLNGYSGQVVRVTGIVEPDEVDPEVGPMYYVIFDDGTTTAAFADELTEVPS